jgi:hypothetical protein
LQKRKNNTHSVLWGLLFLLVFYSLGCDGGGEGYTAILANYSLSQSGFDRDRSVLACTVDISISDTTGTVLLFLYGTRSVFAEKDGEPLETIHYSKSELETLFAVDVILPLATAEFSQNIEIATEDATESRIIEWTFVLSDIESNLIVLTGSLVCSP